MIGQLSKHLQDLLLLIKEWLNAGEGVIYFRPGIRYVFAIIHIIFGFSGFAQKIIEPLLIFSGCLFFLFILNKFKINSVIVLLSSILLISSFLVKIIDGIFLEELLNIILFS